jgi:hypothetical protein
VDYLHDHQSSDLQTVFSHSSSHTHTSVREDYFVILKGLLNKEKAVALAEGESNGLYYFQPLLEKARQERITYGDPQGVA